MEWSLLEEAPFDYFGVLNFSWFELPPIIEQLVNLRKILEGHGAHEWHLMGHLIKPPMVHVAPVFLEIFA
ncbi:hypothetical protein Acsp03_42510 [Actinomadura sp. NBRC 104412]|nr:hypothetical protein Acsp03_42510 [Actinomadura sp. NBRC 104412]